MTLSAVQGASQLLHAVRGEGGAEASAVAAEFEALLLGEVWKGAMRPMGFGDGLDGGPAARMYRDRFIEEVMREATKARSSAMTALIERELRAADTAAESGGEPEGGSR